MKKIAPDETTIEGRWVSDAGRVVADDACKRIEDLTGLHLAQVPTTVADGSPCLGTQSTRDFGSATSRKVNCMAATLHGCMLFPEEVRQRYLLE